jgi:hypothetical protein
LLELTTCYFASLSSNSVKKSSRLEASSNKGIVTAIVVVVVIMITASMITVEQLGKVPRCTFERLKTNISV